MDVRTASRSYGLRASNWFDMSSTCFHDSALTTPRLPPAHGILPPRSVATIAIESVSSIAYVPPKFETEYSSRLSMRRAAPVIKDASGGKQYSPGTSGCATRQRNGSTSMPWQVVLAQPEMENRRSPLV